MLGPSGLPLMHLKVLKCLKQVLREEEKGFVGDIFSGTHSRSYIKISPVNLHIKYNLLGFRIL